MAPNTAAMNRNFVTVTSQPSLYPGPNGHMDHSGDSWDRHAGQNRDKSIIRKKGMAPTYARPGKNTNPCAQGFKNIAFDRLIIIAMTEKFI